MFFALLLCHFFLTCLCLVCCIQTFFCYVLVKMNYFFTVFPLSETCLHAVCRPADSLGIWRCGRMEKLSVALCGLWVTWLNILYEFTPHLQEVCVCGVPLGFRSVLRLTAEYWGFCFCWRYSHWFVHSCHFQSYSHQSPRLKERGTWGCRCHC